MNKIRICKRCLYPIHHPYGLTFIDDICSGCYIHEEKYSIDWDKRFSDLLCITNKIKKSKKNTFDCVIPVTGSGDTYFTIDFVVNVLGLNPLLVHYNTHFNTPVGIRNLSNISNTFNCDMVSSVNAPSTLKKIAKTAFENYGNFYWHAIAGYLTFPVQTAIKYKIPLIIWGVNGWMDQVGMYTHLDSVEMTQRCREEHGMQGIHPNNLLNFNSGISKNDLNNFIYPDNNKVSQLNLRGIYLNNFIFWDSKQQHEKMIRNFNYETRLMERTFNYYEDAGCLFANGANDYLRYMKHGFSKVSDHVSRDIRLKRLTIETGKDHILNYTTKIPSDISLLCNWLEITETKFYEIANKFKNKAHFQNFDSEKSHYIEMLEGLDLTQYSNFKCCNEDKDINYILTKNREFVDDYKQIMIGRVYTDKYNYGHINDTPNGNGKLI
jgi:N-acetyl sugar amidotransferase